MPGAPRRSIVSLASGSLAQQIIATTVRPAAAGDGVDIKFWRTNNQFSAGMAAVFLSGTAPATVNAPAGALGAELWGYAMTKWWLAGVLHDGLDIPIIGASQGFMQQLSILGIFERLAVAATVSAGIVTATFVPVEAYQ